MCVFLVLPAALIASGHGDLPYRPAPGRDFILVTDFIAGFPVDLSSERNGKLDLSTELGLLLRLDEGHHLGPAVSFGCWLDGGWHSRWGVSARYRLELSERMCVDVAPGLILSDSPYPDGFAGFSLGASLVMDSWIGLHARLDATESLPEGTDTVLRLGLGIGGEPGLYTSAAASVAGLIAWRVSEMD
ncbi:MAG: hypothetical protein JXR55_06515 [Candidatus Fermentibacteraceae bacterium]|nr:hypothetical protein [Candidatus Fermentibacteraceae bacterium]